MINSAYDLSYYNEEDGTLIGPSGPCSAWPKDRNKAAGGMTTVWHPPEDPMVQAVTEGAREKANKPKVNLGQMASNLVKTSIQAVSTGKADKGLRDKRYAMCLECPHFIEQSKRCSECGCFMEAKTWIKGASCPVGKW